MGRGSMGILRVVMGMLVLLPAVIPSAALASWRGKALVIGNADYRQEARLRNPVNDAEAMAAVLPSLGFAVTLLPNGSQAAMENAVREFSKPGQGGGIGLFYFSGHGVQLDGQNYLIPVDALVESDADVRYKTVSASWVLKKMEDAGYRLHIAILDACRNNPLRPVGTKSAAKGLARMKEPPDSLVAYATAPDTVADDNPAEKHGLYTKHLLQALPTPGLSLGDMFVEVTAAVKKESGGKQVPWISSSISEKIVLMPLAPETQVAVSISSSPPALEKTLRGKDGKEMLLVPEGWFVMGSTGAEIRAAYELAKKYYPQASRDFFADEAPQHWVWLDAFYMDRYEVTMAEYETFRRTTGKPKLPDNVATYAPGEQHPVVAVTWEEASSYCQWAGKQLPSEAQWEKAARSEDGRLYPWGNAVLDGQRANFCDAQCDRDWKDKNQNDGYRYTAPVGSYAAAGKSPDGIEDLAGNALEWVQDWYDAAYYRNSPQRNPVNDTSGTRRVLRGGSWANNPAYSRLAHRGRLAPAARDVLVGFRCVIAGAASRP